ncbi:flavodoxin family protein [Eubacteriales bacterium OttesenSCG-928-A19]|nr:flavodoxin family protein [Eubacteriales bacterium OttesenSCG-928-A19]
MLLVLHDLPPALAEEVLPPPDGETALFVATPAVAPCVGCFACWTRTPGICVIDDRAREFARLLPGARRLCVITRCVYGGVSPDVKAVLDRSIGYMLPYFKLVRGEMHHVQRYERPFDLRYYFYGEDITEGERATAEALIAANALNYSSPSARAHFYPDARALKGVRL